MYGRFIKRKGSSKAELILEMRDAKLETSVLDLDPDKPLKDQIESADPVNAAEKKRTEDMRRGVKAIFEIFDTAGKGALSTHTLGAAFQKLGVKYTPELLALAMTEFDADNNGALDFEEFYELLLMLKQAREHREEAQPAHVFAEDEICNLRKSFDEFDGDGEGSLDHAELLEATKACGVDSIEDAEIVAIIEQFDVNNDGTLTFDEFLTMMSALSGGARADSVAPRFERRAAAVDRNKQVQPK